MATSSISDSTVFSRLGGQMSNSVHSRRRRNLRTTVRQFGTTLQQIRANGVASMSPEQRENAIQKMAGNLERPIGLLFENAGLDIKNTNDWWALICIIAAALYSPKGPGRRRRWSKKQTTQFRMAVQAMRNRDANLTDLECCKKLAQKYGVRPKTLLRRLYDETTRSS